MDLCQLLAQTKSEKKFFKSKPHTVTQTRKIKKTNQRQIFPDIFFQTGLNDFRQVWRQVRFIYSWMQLFSR